MGIPIDAFLLTHSSDRITLLVHLIRHTPQAEISNPRRLGQEPELYAKDLKEAIEERKNTIPQDKWEIIEEIIRVRTKEESFERGEIGWLSHCVQSELD